MQRAGVPGHNRFMSARFFNVLCRLTLALCLLGAALQWPGAARADRLTVFAAASLKPVLDDLKGTFEQTTDHELTLVYAGTSILARQIEQGAPADVFIAASADWMDRLEKAGLISPDSRFDLIGNALVLVGFDGSGAGLPDALAANQRVAMAFVDAVPAGLYGKAALEALGLWPQVAPNVVQTDNVRLALALVTRREVPLGIVYASDAQSVPDLPVLGRFAPDLHPPILYPAAAIAGRDGAASQSFLSFLREPSSTDAFFAAGFEPVEG